MNTMMSSKICRICCNRRTDDLVSLLDTENKTIVKKLRACADIAIEHDDLLPKYICAKCIGNLNLAYSFKIQCEYMDQKLREVITKMIQKHTDPAIVLNDDVEPTEDGTTEGDSSFDGDSEQATMDGVESIIEEDCNKQEVVIATTNLEASEINRVANDNASHNIEGNVMNLSQTVVEVQQFDSCGTLPSAKDSNEIIDQDMYSVKSDTSSPKLKRSSKCDTCGETFFVLAEFNKHIKTHGKNRYQCLVCNRWFAKKYLLNAHQKTHSGIKAHECNLCQKRYTNQGNLDRHIRVFHRKERQHTCTTCQKTFSQLSILRSHQAVHVAERQFCCDVCQSKFKTEVHLKLHKKRHMPTEYRPKRKYIAPKKAYKPPKQLCVCNECGNRFTSVALLRSHMQSHSFEKKYECSFCKKRFSFQQTLRNHVFLHTGEKRFKCDICNISFRQIGHLQGHKLIHSGIKPHSCSVCNKAFALRGNLTVHMRTHGLGTNPYQCSICPKKYNDSNGLKRHLLMHERKNQINPAIEQILQAPIIEAPIAETLPTVGSTFGSIPTFNVSGEVIQFIPTPEVIPDNTQLIFKIQ